MVYRPHFNHHRDKCRNFEIQKIKNYIFNHKTILKTKCFPQEKNRQISSRGKDETEQN